MKIAVIGSRTFTDFDLMKSTLEPFKLNISELISGGAIGADKLAKHWAELNGIKVSIFLPDWEKMGRGAGIARNKKMVDQCDYCIAFWDGSSRGTAFSIQYCEKRNKPVKVIHYK